MNNLKKFFLFSLFLLSANLVFSQQGTIRGTVFDEGTGEPIMFATIFIVENSGGTTTDLDGKYTIDLAPGTYNFKISYLGYTDLSVSDIIIVEGQDETLDFQLAEESQMIEEIVVTATQVRDTEAAIMTIQKKSPNLINGISSQTFKKIGDGDAAGAVKRVTGVSVEGGKYVYVRGLGDRYTKTMLNGMDIPGLDPDRNSLQIDIFPTNLISNMFVLKSSLAELPADFTGGVVNIETKDFPEEKVFDVSFSLGFNPDQHLNDNYISYEGGGTDFLGFDNGTRELPNFARFENVPSPISGDLESNVFNFVDGFNPTLGATPKRSTPDFSLGLSYADQINIGNSNNRSLGYVFSATYKNSTQFLDEVQYGEYQKQAASEVFELEYATRQDGIIGSNSVLFGGLAGLAYKSSNSKIRLMLMHLQNGESKAAQLNIDNSDSAVGQSGYAAFSNNLEYAQRSLTNLLLHGKHVLDDNGWELEWKVSPTVSKLDEPDIRKTSFTLQSDDFLFVAGAGGNPKRIWRYLDEININSRLDFTKELNLFKKDAKLKFGVSHLMKERDYEILVYDLQSFGTWPTLSGEANEVLVDDNIYPNGPLYYTSGNGTPNSNEYNSTVSNSAGYASLEFSPVDKLKTIVGLRAENFVQKHTGRDQQLINVLDDETVLESLDLFPSANMIYSLNENQNLRLSYSRSIARPSFKELTYAQILDPLTDRIFNGSLFTYNDWDGNLTETRINNYDLRWEMFGSRAQNLSISGFYKTFDNPIELVRIPEAQTSNEFQPRNVGNGKVLGLEVEFGKSLGFLNESASKFSLNGNVTVVHSSIEMTETEFNSRRGFEKVGETVQATRNMAGQAPLIINAGVSYNDSEKGFDAGLFYNVKGETLTIVGGGLFPDVYSRPFHSLNFNLNYDFGVEDKFALNFGVNNILNSQREQFYGAFQAQDQIFSRFSPDTSISLGLKYSIF